MARKQKQTTKPAEVTLTVTPASLNNSQIEEIRKLHATGEYMFKELADKFGVSKDLIALALVEF